MDFWNSPIVIGSRSFPRFIGGPLDGITDSPFRQLVRDFSKDELLYTEMRHVACIANEKGGYKALRFAQMERPLNYQIAANKLDCIEPACEKIVQCGVDMIDLNAGCPAKNVIGSGSGSALMADVPRLKHVVSLIRACVPHIPFTVKIRAGFKEQNAVEVAKMLNDCGVDAIAIHPRLRTQKFEGRPNYPLVAEVKKAVCVPVIVSGGVVNWKTAKMVHEQTGADGFLIGRGIWSKPWKLHELREHSQGRDFSVDNETILNYAIKHLDAMIAYYGDRGLYAFRKHLPFYIRGGVGASAVRQTLVRTNDPNELKKVLREFLVPME